MILVQHNGRTVVKARSTQGWDAWVWCYAGSLFEDCTRVYILSGYLCVLNEQVGRNKGQQRGGSCRSASDMRRACSLFGLYVFIYIYTCIYIGIDYISTARRIGQYTVLGMICQVGLI